MQKKQVALDFLLSFPPIDQTIDFANDRHTTDFINIYYLSLIIDHECHLFISNIQYSISSQITMNSLPTYHNIIYMWPEKSLSLIFLGDFLAISKWAEKKTANICWNLLKSIQYSSCKKVFSVEVGFFLFIIFSCHLKNYHEIYNIFGNMCISCGLFGKLKTCHSKKRVWIWT